MKKLLICTALISLGGMSAEAMQFVNNFNDRMYFRIMVGKGLVIGRYVEANDHRDVSSQYFISNLDTIRQHYPDITPETKFKIVVIGRPYVQPIPCKPKMKVADAETLANATIAFRVSEDGEKTQCTVE